MKFFALLCVIALLPIAAGGGFALKPDPGLEATIEGDLIEIGEPTDEWLYVVTKGPVVGQVADAGFVSQFMTPAQLKEAGAEAGIYIVRTCRLLSTTGKLESPSDPVVVNYCTQREVTKAEVLDYVKTAGATGPVG